MAGLDDYDMGGGGPMEFVRQGIGRFGRAQSEFQFSNFCSDILALFTSALMKLQNLGQQQPTITQISLHTSSTYCSFSRKKILKNHFETKFFLFIFKACYI